MKKYTKTEAKLLRAMKPHKRLGYTAPYDGRLELTAARKLEGRDMVILVPGNDIRYRRTRTGEKIEEYHPSGCIILERRYSTKFPRILKTLEMRIKYY